MTIREGEQTNIFKRNHWSETNCRVGHIEGIGRKECLLYRDICMQFVTFTNEIWERLFLDDVVMQARNLEPTGSHLKSMVTFSL